MRILPRYIAKMIYFSIGIVALIITSILFILSVLGEAKNVGQGDYGLGQSIIYVLLHLPNEIYHFSPLFILLGSIIGLSILSSQRELAVMRASGFSISKIIYSLLSAALLLILLMSFLGEWLGPSLSYKAVVRKENAQNAGVAVVTASGIWFHLDNNFIHINRVVDKHLLNDVTCYQFDHKHQLKKAYFAKTLVYENHHWQMHDVTQTVFEHEKTRSDTFTTLPWNLRINTHLLNAGLIVPSDMGLSKLAEFSRYLQKNGLQSSEYEFNYWQRILQPFAALIMIFLAIPFVLGALSTQSLGLRIMMGILVGFAFFILNAILGQVAVVYQLPAFIAALLPLVLFFIFGVVLCRKLIRT